MMLLLALMFYLHYEAEPDERNFSTVLDLIRSGAIEDEDSVEPSTLDLFFDELESRDPNHIALKYYKAYHSGSGKTLKSIQITLLARLEKFNLSSLAGITRTDDLQLDKIGERKSY